jgi:heme-degrading monooxygenase HmoA
LSDEVAVLLLADIAPASNLWGWSRIVLGPRALRSVPCLRFAKVLGSGYEGGFGLRPSSSRQGLFAVFSNLSAAEEFVGYSELVATYRQRARELCVIKLKAWSCRGSWDGAQLSASATAPAVGRIAALTRASIHLHKAPAFWRYAPAAQASLESAQGVQLAVGLGEAPFLRQATFSIWDTVDAMDAYARSGAHLDAIRAAATNQYFSESMFVRFVPLSIAGTWKGRQYG